MTKEQWEKIARKADECVRVYEKFRDAADHLAEVTGGKNPQREYGDEVYRGFNASKHIQHGGKLVELRNALARSST